MGVGHVAVALGAAKAAPRLNTGWLVFAALLADFLVGVFSLVGIEQAHVPPEYPVRHYLTFAFPYSHGFLALLLWGAIAGFLVTRLSSGRTRVFWVVALLVVSHFILDGL